MGGLYQQIVQSIIGYFNLDPNRVLDVILDSFECHLDRHEFYVALLRDFTPDPSTLNELMAFKFKFYAIEVSHKVNNAVFDQRNLTGMGSIVWA